jgi:hypothetical protein
VASIAGITQYRLLAGRLVESPWRYAAVAPASHRGRYVFLARRPVARLHRPTLPQLPPAPLSDLRRVQTAEAQVAVRIFVALTWRDIAGAL